MCTYNAESKTHQRVQQEMCTYKSGNKQSDGLNEWLEVWATTGLTGDEGINGIDGKVWRNSNSSCRSHDTNIKLSAGAACCGSMGLIWWQGGDRVEVEVSIIWLQQVVQEWGQGLEVKVEVIIFDFQIKWAGQEMGTHKAGIKS